MTVGITVSKTWSNKGCLFGQFWAIFWTFWFWPKQIKKIGLDQKDFWSVIWLSNTTMMIHVNFTVQCSFANFFLSNIRHIPNSMGKDYHFVPNSYKKLPFKKNLTPRISQSDQAIFIHNENLLGHDCICLNTTLKLLIDDKKSQTYSYFHTLSQIILYRKTYSNE